MAPRKKGPPKRPNQPVRRNSLHPQRGASPPLRSFLTILNVWSRPWRSFPLHHDLKVAHPETLATPHQRKTKLVHSILVPLVPAQPSLAKPQDIGDHLFAVCAWSRHSSALGFTPDLSTTLSFSLLETILMPIPTPRSSSQVPASPSRTR